MASGDMRKHCRKTESLDDAIYKNILGAGQCPFETRSICGEVSSISGEGIY